MKRFLPSWIRKSVTRITRRLFGSNDAAGAAPPLTTRKIADCQLPIADCQLNKLSPGMGSDNRKSEIGNRKFPSLTTHYSPLTQKPANDVQDRRTAFASLAALAAAPLAFWGLPKLKLAALVGADHGHDAESDGKKRRKWGMVIDLDRCTGCQACVVSCRAENNVPVAGPEQAALGRGIFWMDMFTEAKGEYPDLHRQFIPTPCNHCENPPCIKVCPVGATHISEEGIVAQIWARCIGCRYCTTACPYTRRYFNWQAPNWPEESRNQLNPDVATRPRGVVEKCTFCHHRIRKVREKAKMEGREITDEEVTKLPACAEACPADAIVFGDLNDPESEVTRLSKSPRAFRLEEELGTRPKVIYLREAKWSE